MQIVGPLIKNIELRDELASWTISTTMKSRQLATRPNYRAWRDKRRDKLLGTEYNSEYTDQNLYRIFPKEP